MKQDIKLFIDNVKIDTKDISNVSIDFQFKDLKEFSKRKTSYSKPVSILQTKSNAKLFGAMYNINETGGWDKESRPKGRIEVNNIIVLEGKVKLSNITSVTYEVQVYKDEVNLETLFRDETLRGNGDKSKDLIMSDATIHRLTVPYIRENFMRAPYIADGKHISFPKVEYKLKEYPKPINDEIRLPAVPAKEIMTDLLASKGMTITYSPEILKSLNNIVIQYNGEYTDFCQPWSIKKYKIGTKELVDGSSDPYGYRYWGDIRTKYDRITGAGDATSVSSVFDNMYIQTRGKYHVKLTLECKKTKMPNKEETEDDIKAVPKWKPHFTINEAAVSPFRINDVKLTNAASSDGKNTIQLLGLDYHSGIWEGDFEIANTAVSEGATYCYISHDEQYFSKDYGHPEITGTIEITQIDSYYSGNVPITKTLALPHKVKKKDLFNNIMTQYNGIITLNGSSLYMSTLGEFLTTGINKFDWTDKFADDNPTFKTIKSTQDKVGHYKIAVDNDLYSSDYKEQTGHGFRDYLPEAGTKEIEVKALTYAGTTSIQSVYGVEIATMYNKSGEFSTKFKDRMLFVSSYKYKSADNWGFDVYGSGRYITDLNYATTRLYPDKTNPDNITMGFDEAGYYGWDDFQYPGDPKETTGNFYTKFYKGYDYADSNLMFLEAKFNLSEKDINDVKDFKGLIYVNTPKNGGGWFRLNKIDNYKPGANKLTKVELIQVDPTVVIDNTSTVEILDKLELSLEGVKEKISYSTGTSSGGGSTSLDAAAVQKIVDNGLAGKLDLDGIAVNSDKLDGHDTDYFASKTQLDDGLATKLDLHAKADDSDKLDGIDSVKFARRDTENTFESNQKMKGNLEVDNNLRIKGNLEVDGDTVTKNTTNVAIADNLFGVNVGETGAGPASGYAGMYIDMGTLDNRGLVIDNSDKKLKWGILDVKEGTVVSARDSSHITVASDKLTGYIGKKIKFTTPTERQLVSSVTAFNPSTKEITVSPALPKLIDNTWKWALLDKLDLKPIMLYDGALSNGNPTIWNSAKGAMVDAGKKYALRNGEISQNFSANDLYASNRVRIGNSITNIYGQFYSDRIASYDAHTSNYIDLGLNNDRTILANADGTLESKGLHSKTYVSGILGTGFNIAASSEMDSLSIRDELKVNTFINNKINIHNGDMILSDSATVHSTNIPSKVLYFEEMPPFEAGDKIRAQQLAADNTSLSTYYLKVQSVGKSTISDDYFITYVAIGRDSDTPSPSAGIPKANDLLVRWNGPMISLVTSDVDYGPYQDFAYDGLSHARIGNLSGINSPIFGQLQGYGAYMDNVYLRGKIEVSGGNVYTKDETNTNIGSAESRASTDAATRVKGLKDTLGTLAYDSSVELAKLGTTIIQGGFLKTDLIDAKKLYVGAGGIRIDSTASIEFGQVNGGQDAIDTAKTEAIAAAELDATNKANDAKDAAIKSADAAANLAETKAKAHADGIVTAEETRAIKDATDKANAAEKAASDKAKIAHDAAVAAQKTADSKITAIESTKITKDTVTAPFIKGLKLEVGNEILMGANAEINWKKVIGADTEVTKITKDTVDAPYMKTLNLKVGDEIQMGPNARIAWDKLDGAVAATTKITNDTLETTNVIATNLQVAAAHITGKLVATQINFDGATGTNMEITGTIKGSKISGTDISGGNIVGATIKTAASGRRIEMHTDTSSALDFYRTSGYSLMTLKEDPITSPLGNIQGGIDMSSNAGIRILGSGTAYFQAGALRLANSAGDSVTQILGGDVTAKSLTISEGVDITGETVIKSGIRHSNIKRYDGVSKARAINCTEVNTILWNGNDNAVLTLSLGYMSDGQVITLINANDDNGHRIIVNNCLNSRGYFDLNGGFCATIMYFSDDFKSPGRKGGWILTSLVDNDW